MVHDFMNFYFSIGLLLNFCMGFWCPHFHYLLQKLPQFMKSWLKFWKKWTIPELCQNRIFKRWVDPLGAPLSEFYIFFFNWPNLWWPYLNQKISPRWIFQTWIMVSEFAAIVGYDTWFSQQFQNRELSKLTPTGPQS